MEALDRHRRLRRQFWIKLVAFIGVLILVAVGLFAIENLLLSVVLAVMVSYIVSPLVSYLEGTGMSRLFSIGLVYCFFTVVTGVAVWAITPFLLTQLKSLKGRAPEYVDGTVQLFNDFTAALDTHTGGILQIDFSERLREWLTAQSAVFIDELPSALSSSASVLFLSPLLGFFILKDGRAFARALLRLVPNNIFELVLNLQHQISQQIAHYIRARLLESAIVATVCFVGFLSIQFPYAALLALFAAVANLIPYVGPLFGAAPGIILALLNHVDGVMLTLVILIYVIAQLIDNFLIIPLVVARIVNLHPVTVILAVLLGAQMMGILGMLISIPVASTLKVTFRSIYDHLTDYPG